MPRNADDILIGGGRVFVDDKELGWLTGEIKTEEQANSQTIKESEGGSVLVIATDKEVHLTFSLLEANLETLKALNPSSSALSTSEGTGENTGFAVGTFQSDNTFKIEFWHKKRSGKYRCVRFFKGKLSGSFTPLIINQDNESPIAIDIIAMADEERDTTKNLYEIFDTATAPGEGW